MTDTQHERILAMLRAEPEGVCGVTFLQTYMPTYSQRIGELRRDKGYTIIPIECPYSWHTHNGNIGTYQLIEGIHSEQLSMTDA
jgi:hypothetical protein